MLKNGVMKKRILGDRARFMVYVSASFVNWRSPCRAAPVSIFPVFRCI
ncbi:hypothetical protein SAMN02745857_02955 [Andreprevotia lacus DSM 23236]|jgi:hypothetical protein|uniref:Uncharacterized protein n=1 Tax=Andreprevotia lacus DSM 23236 TaxID=1121001 RepID=A0A1W1XUT6_9NEIS|nr:hypothetical protein SAMN02745857_02955 [Andreprevotia lacus DSM 23236]